MSSRSITIDPITRLQGHGRIHLFLDQDGSLADASLQVPELRGFEAFCRGRPVEEMARITTRICGICPVAHHLAAVKAAEAVYGVTPPRPARKLRELLFSGFIAGDHTTHFYTLSGPDYLLGPEAPPAERSFLGVVARLGGELGSEVIRQRARCQRVVQIVGGKVLHPVTALPGGMSKRVTKEEQQELIQIAKQMVEFAKATVKVFETAILAQGVFLDLIRSQVFRLPTYSVGMVDADQQVSFYEGTVRIVDPDGKEVARFGPDDYLEHIAEAVLSHSYLKYPYLKRIGWQGLADGNRSGVYSTTPLSRLNVAQGMSTPLAQAEYERLFDILTGDRSGHTPVHATLAIHWARVVELLFACEATLQQAQDDEITSDKIHTPPTGMVGEGVGMVEAPRGLLIHHYKTDRNAMVLDANLIVGTTHNHAAISLSIQKAAAGLIQKGQEVREKTLNLIEMAVRAYDPCFGCATHAAAGRMPLEILVHDCTGRVVETIHRFD